MATVPANSDFAVVLPGDPAPWFKQRSLANPRYSFDVAAGRYIVLGFLGTAGDDHARAAIAAVANHPTFFDDMMGCFFGVTIDPKDEQENRIAERYPGMRYLLDFDLSISRLYGAVTKDQQPGDQLAYRRFWMVLDPELRVVAHIPFQPDQSDIAQLLAALAQLPRPGEHCGIALGPPILCIPGVIEPEFCERLIDLYRHNGGQPSGFMREIDGITRLVTDPAHKRRRDFMIEDQALQKKTSRPASCAGWCRRLPASIIFR